MKILSDKQIGKVYGSTNVENWTPHTWGMPRRVAIEAQKDTLRQVRELLDGKANPYALQSPRWFGFHVAIQTIKALLEE